MLKKIYLMNGDICYYDSFFNSVFYNKPIHQENINNPKIENFSHIYTENEYRWKILHQQKQLILSLTENCNLRCKYCVYNDSRYRKEGKNSVMTLSTMKEAIDWFINSSEFSDIVYISFYGGEPLLEYSLIEQAVEYVENYHKKQSKFIITTNGTLFTKEIIDFFYKHNFLITISLDGPKYINDKYRLDRDEVGSYDKVISNIKLIQKLYPEYYENNIGYSVVISPPYEDETIASYFNGIRSQITDVDITPYFDKYLRDKYKDDYINLFERKGIDILKFTLGEEHLKTLVRYHHILRCDANRIYPLASCLPFTRRTFVSCDGNLLPCEKVDEYNEDNILGNVKCGVDFFKIDKLLKKFGDAYNKNCRFCWAARFCPVCFREMDKIELNSFFCNEKRRYVEKDFILYLSLINEDNRWIDFFNNVHNG